MSRQAEAPSAGPSETIGIPRGVVEAPMRPAEVLAITVGLLVLVGAQLYLSESVALFTHHFWLDEFYTYALVADPDPGHALRALASGADTQAPTFYALLRVYTWLARSSNEVSLRIFAMLVMIVGLAGLYACLRWTFAPLPCLAAVLALWCHPLVVGEAFDARCYGLWFASVTWFVYLLIRVRNGLGSWWTKAGVGLCSILVCTSHYFGIVAWLFVVAGEVLGRRVTKSRRLDGMVAVGLGPIGLACCVPMLLSQRHAMTVSTWVSPLDSRSVVTFLDNLWVHPSFTVVALITWVGIVFTPRGADAGRQPTRDLIAQVALSALILVAPALLLLSWMVQPVLVARYGFPTLAALAPAVAFLTSQANRSWSLVLCAALALFGADQVRATAQKWRDEDASTDRLIAEIREMTGKEMVLFESPAKVYVVSRYAPDLAPRCFLLDFEPREIGHVSANRLFMRDLARQYNAFYHEPGLKRWREVAGQKQFFLVPQVFADGITATRSGAYPGFSILPVGAVVYLATHQ